MSKLLYYLKLKNNWAEQKLAERVPSAYFGSVKGETKKMGELLQPLGLWCGLATPCGQLCSQAHTEPTLYRQMQVPAVFY